MSGEQELNAEFILIAGTMGMLTLTTAIITFIYLYQRKLIKRKLAFQEIEDMLKRQELRSTYALLEGQDMERQRIARELHDNLGSMLATLNMYADTFFRIRDEQERNALMTKLTKISRQAYEEARKISHRLDESSLSRFGFKNSLNDLIEAVNGSGTLEVEASVEISNDISNELSINLYRIVQELINNTFKHAMASSIHIDISLINNEYISFIYEDNGIGIQQNIDQAKGIGMRNIEARVEKMNGILKIGDNMKNGFTLIIEIPYDKPDKNTIG